MKRQPKYITALKSGLIVSCCLAGFAAGVAADPTPVIPSPHQITGEWLLDIRTVGAIAGILLPATWIISHYTSKMTEQFMIQAKRLTEGDERFQRIEESLRSLERYLDGLPCNTEHNHPNKKRHENCPTG